MESFLDMNNFFGFRSRCLYLLSSSLFFRLLSSVIFETNSRDTQKLIFKPKFSYFLEFSAVTYKFNLSAVSTFSRCEISAQVKKAIEIRNVSFLWVKSFIFLYIYTRIFRVLNKSRTTTSWVRLKILSYQLKVQSFSCKYLLKMRDLRSSWKGWHFSVTLECLINSQLSDFSINKNVS